MSTENVEVFNRYYGNGVATQFSIGFPYLKREFVKVYLYKKDTDEEEVLNSDQFSFVNDTTIQYPVLSTDEILKEGDILTIQRETELGSEFEFDNQRRLFPVEVMNADDLAFQQIQELSREIKRAVRVNPTAAETPEELLQTVYDKLDSATEIAGDAISAANQAQTAADNATAAVNSAEQTLANVTAYVDSAKVDIDSTVAQAKADVNSAIDEATMDISNIVSDAEGSITNIAVTEANKAIANAAQEATDMATASLNSYVDGTVKPSLQTYVDQAQEDANSAATSMEQAALSATAASNYASNASADADNAAESAGLAANSAAEASNSEEKAAEYLQQIGNKITAVEGSIGDIGIAPFGIDEAQNKRRYLNGQVISQSQFVSFTNKVKAAVQLYPSLATSETNWQATVTNSKLGQCGKFVIDDTAGTIRLPKVVNVQGLQDLSLLGGIKSESLPNITGTFRGRNAYNGDASTNESVATGAFGTRDESGTKSGAQASGTNNFTWTFNASRSSSTYQDNAPVQQEAVQYPYFIQVARGVEESVDVTREIELNNPFFFGMHIWSDTAISNVSWLISNSSYHSGATYASFYEWLLQKRNEKYKQLFGWKRSESLYWTDTETPQINDLVYGYGHNSRIILGYVSAVDGSSITVNNTYTANNTTGCVRYTSIDAFSYIIDKDGINFVTNKDVAANYPSGYNHNFDYDYVINTADTTFRLPIKVKLASGNAVVGNGMAVGVTDGTYLAGLRSTVANTVNSCLNLYGEGLGIEDVTNGVATNKSLGITTDPTKSGIETSSSGLKLYFYVGETIQDANVIAASGVLTKVVNSIDRTSATDRATVVGWGMPDYSAGIDVTSEFSAGQWWTATKAGWYVISAGADSYFEIRASDNGTLIVAGAGPTPYILSTGTFVADVGQRLYCSKKSGSYPVAVYYPFKGAN